MHYDCKIECWNAENVYTLTWMAYLLFHNFHFNQCHRMPQEAFWGEEAFQPEVPPVLAERSLFLCASSLSADSLLCHFGMEGGRQYDIYKPLLGAFLSQPSPCSAWETQHRASSLLRLQPDVSLLVVAFPLLRHAKTHLSRLWRLWPHSRQGKCRTVPAVPDLIASP